MFTVKPKFTRSVRNRNLIRGAIDIDAQTVNMNSAHESKITSVLNNFSSLK